MKHQVVSPQTRHVTARVEPLKRVVEIIGQVKKPGYYYYSPGMKLNDLIQLSGGFSDSTFWKSVYHNQAEIIRLDSKSRYSEIIKLSLIDLYNGNSEWYKSLKIYQIKNNLQDIINNIKNKLI